MQAAAAATKNVTASGLDLTKLGTQFQQVGRMATLGLSAPIVAAGVAATGMSNKFSTSFTRMTTLAGISTSEIGKMRDSVLSLSKETGRGPQELADALYMASSSGLDAAQSLAAVEIAAKASASGMGSAGDIVSLVASATAAYGAANMDAATATDILIGTIRAGSADPDELAGSLGRVLPPAAALGVAFEDVGGSVAFLSTAMGNTDRAVTAMSGILQKLSSPTDQAREALNQYGSSMQELHAIIAEDGILGAMRHLQEIGLADDPLAFRAVFDDVEARQGAQAMIGNLEGVATAMDVVKDSSGALGEVWSATQGERGFEMAQSWAEIQVALIEFGDAVGPIAADIAGAVAQVASAFASLPDGVQMAVAGVLIALGPMAMIAGTFMKHAQTIAAARALATGTAAAPGGRGGPSVIGGPAKMFGIGLAAYYGNEAGQAADDWLSRQTGGRIGSQQGMDPWRDRPVANTRPSGFSASFDPGDIERKSGFRASANLTQEAGEAGRAFDLLRAAWPVAEMKAAVTQLDLVQAAVRRAADPVGAATRHYQAYGESLAATAAEAERLRQANEAAIVQQVSASDEWVGSINRTIDVAGEQYEAFQRAQQITQEYALATASTDWGAASLQGAAAAMAQFTADSFGLVNIAMASEEAFDRLGASVEENGKSFDVATEAGRANMSALQGVAATLDTQFSSAYVGANGDMATFMWTATKIGNETLGRLQTELGLTDEETAALAETLNLTATDYEARFELSGDAEAKVRLGLLSGVIGLLQEDVQREVAMHIATGNFNEALRVVQENIARTPREKFVNIYAVDNATGTVQSIQRKINSLTGRSVTITTNRVTNDIVNRSYNYGPRGSNVMSATSEGRFVPGGSWMVSTLGEDAGAYGDEVVLPLGKPNRMRALLADPRVMGPLSKAMFNPSSASSAAASTATSSGASSVTIINNRRDLTHRELAMAMANPW